MSNLNRILVIDEVPVIALGLQKTISTVNPGVSIDFEEHIFTVLSAKAYSNKSFDLVILGVVPNIFPETLQEIVTDLKTRFGHPKIMLFVNSYLRVVPENMEQMGIDAYVHKHETPEEVQKAYLHITGNERYISDMFATLYNDYHLHKTEQEPQYSLLPVTALQKNILQQVCEGKTLPEIAAHLQLPQSYVQQQLQPLQAYFDTHC